MGVLKELQTETVEIFAHGQKDLSPQSQKVRADLAHTERKNLASEKQPQKPRRQESADQPGHSTFGSSPSEAEETVLECLSTNCLGLSNRLGDVKQSAYIDQPSINALTETWLTRDVTDAATLPYQCRSSSLTQPRTLLRCTVGPNTDARVLFPPSRTLEQLSSNYHFTHLLLVGGFNAPKASWIEFQRVQSGGLFAAALIEVVHQSAWTQNVVAPTRYRAGQKPSLLDFVITNGRHFVDQRHYDDTITGHATKLLFRY
ncbi:hypothetical protein T265_04856 [Opisthorchis viverrini]|uniref:Endonuclease/exonuclease/phosphatase domain-containing protein n=1 Tax=Opisthorchis viverrini TaxID=6198 RepID=A0A074ZLM5_OPIVI|nr:hypothetical protein T265_04856 [Opisthorchis viverrini]KER28253.1 hypothetical protein T265_04856 [Opisthorchis viverrini]